MEFSPSRIEVLQTYLRRIFYWRRNSSPYISGDAFADFTDFVYNPPKFRAFKRQRHRIIDAKSVYVVGTDFDNFQKKYAKKISPRVIVIGNSDFELSSIDLSLFGNELAIFAQNCFVSNNFNIFTIPIGLENIRLGMNGLPKYMGFERWENREKRIMFGPFGRTHPMRGQVMEAFKAKRGPWDVYDGYIGPKKFSETSSRYQYVAAVRGNGVDTHRVWETLYRGAIPIVIQDSWSKSLTHLGLPFLTTPDWRPATIKELIRNHHAEPFDPGTIPALWMPYWMNKLENFLK